VAATGFELEFDGRVLQHSTHRRGGREEKRKGWGEEDDRGSVAEAHQAAVAADAEDADAEDAASSPVLVRGAGEQSVKLGAGEQSGKRGAGGQRGQKEEAADAASLCCLPRECVDKVHARVPSMPGAPSEVSDRTWRQGNQKNERVTEGADAPKRVGARPVGRDGQRLSRVAAGGVEEERGGGSRGVGTRATAQVPCKNSEKGKDRGKAGIENVGGVDAEKGNSAGFGAGGAAHIEFRGFAVAGEAHLAAVDQRPPAVMNRSGVPALAAIEGATFEGPQCAVGAARAGVFEGFTFMLCEMDVVATGAPSAASVVVSATGLTATGTLIGKGGAASHGDGRGGGAGSRGNGIPGLFEVIERAGGRVVGTGRGLLDGRTGCAPCPKCNRCSPVDYEVYPVWPLSRPSEQGREREQGRAARESLDHAPLAAACQGCKVLEARGAAACTRQGGATGTVQVSEFWVRKCAALGERVSVASLQLHLPNSLPSLPPEQAAKLRSMRGTHVCLSGVHGHEKRFYKWFITQVLPALSLKKPQPLFDSSASCTRHLICLFQYPRRLGARVALELR